MRDFLASEGYDVFTYPDWRTAGEAIAEWQAHLIILDILMGGEAHGWSILEQLRRDARTQHLPVIVCSADVAALEEHALLLDTYHVVPLVKPFDLDALAGIITTGINAGKRA